MGIPETKPINPFSKTDWAETGVEPDVKVKAADALETAKKLAQSKLAKEYAHSRLRRLPFRNDGEGDLRWMLRAQVDGVLRNLPTTVEKVYGGMALAGTDRE
jgi:hypothetical protein